MKKIRYILIAVFMLILGMTFSGYGADTIYADEIATVSDVPTILDMRILKGQAAFLTYQLPSVRYHFYSAADGTPMVEVGYPEIIKWSSSNSSIATVDNGIVYAWSEGTVTAKMSYRYVFPSGYIEKGTASAKVRVAAYYIQGSQIVIEPALLVDNDLTYSLNDALEFARDNATAEVPYTVIVPAGNYKITSNLRIYSNTTLDLTAGVRIACKAPSGYNMLLLGTNGSYMGVDDYNSSALCAGYSGFSNVTIKGGTWVGNDNNTSMLVRMAHATNVTFDGVTFSGGGGNHQMEVAAIDGFYLRNCTFKNFKGIKNGPGNYEALQMDVPCDKVPYDKAYRDGTVMRNVEITGCTFSNLQKGLGTHTQLLGAYHDNIKINNNTFKNIEQEAIICLAYINSEIKDNYMTNCGTGILFQYYLPNTYSTYSTIFDGTVKYDQPIRHNANTEISGNRIGVRYRAGGLDTVAIKVSGENRTSTINGFNSKNPIEKKDYYVGGVTVAENVIITAGYGIRMIDAKNCYVMDNKIVGKNFSAKDPHIKRGLSYEGIYITKASTLKELSGNTIMNMNGGGIYLDNSKALGGIYDNTIAGVQMYGIQIYNNAKVKDGIVGNTIRSNKAALALIRINNGSANNTITISDNVLKGYKKTNDGIILESGKILVNDNTFAKVANKVVAGKYVKSKKYGNVYKTVAATEEKS